MPVFHPPGECSYCMLRRAVVPAHRSEARDGSFTVSAGRAVPLLGTVVSPMAPVRLTRGLSVHWARAQTRLPPEYTITARGTPRLSLAGHHRHDLEGVHPHFRGEFKGDNQSPVRGPLVPNEPVLNGIVGARYHGAYGAPLQSVNYALCR